MLSISKPVYRLLFSLIAPLAFLGYSCTDDPEQPGPGTNPPAYGSRAVLASSVATQDISSTRAEEGVVTGLPEESRVVSARIILYNPDAYPVNIVSLADYKEIGYDGDTWSWTQDNLTVPDETVGFHFEVAGEEFAPEISFYWTNLPVARYSLAVLLNPQGNTAGEMLDSFGPDGDGRSYLEILASGNESYNYLNPDNPYYHNIIRLFSQTARTAYLADLNIGAYAYETEINDIIRNALCGGITSPFVNLSATGTGTDSGQSDIDNNLKFLMSNADEFINIDASNFRETISQAKANPVALSVERAVAKVAVFNETGMTAENDFYTLANGDRISADISWSSDIVNMYTSFMRGQADMAPGAPGYNDMDNHIETPRTPRKYRYAKITTFPYLESTYANSISWQGLMLTEGRTMQSLIDSRTDGWYAYYPSETYYLTRYFSSGAPETKGRVWNDMPATSSQEDWLTWEYVPENALNTNQQYGDVSTSVMLMTYYIPADDNFIVNSELPVGYRIDGGADQVIVPGDMTEGSYYMFNGTGIAKNVLEHLYDLYFNTGFPFDMEVLTLSFPMLENIDIAFEMIAQEYAAWYSWKNSGSAPSDTSAEAVFRNWFCNKADGYLWSYSQAGLTYYPAALHCYPIPIPHFEAALSPEDMGYGRYGIVRNNVYKISITGINGPGRPAYQPAQGANNFGYGNNIQVNFDIEGWNTIPLRFEL